MELQPAQVESATLSPDAAKVVSMVVQKGGTTKTTSAAHIAYALSRLGWNVLLVDAAPNSSLTTTQIGFDPYEGDEKKYLTIADVLTPPVELGAAMAACVRPDGWQPDPTLPWEKGGAHLPGGSLWLLPGWGGLQQVADNVTTPASHKRLELALTGVSRQFDCVIIDNDPAVGNVFAMAILASGFAMAPVVPEPGAADGLANQIDAIDAFSAAWQHPIEFIGSLCCRYQRIRTASHKVILDEMTQLLSDNADEHGWTGGRGLMFPEVVPEAGAVLTAQLRRLPAATVRNDLARRVDNAYAAAALRMATLMRLPKMNELRTQLDANPLPGVWPLTTEQDENA